MEIEVFHTLDYVPIPHTFPKYATGNEMWLGDGYYFWQDYEFSKWWGENKRNQYKRYTVYKAKLVFDEDEFIDTVFNQDDYYNFVRNIERFAKLYQGRYRKKPSLEEFNEFIADHNLWTEISIIRFQDVPTNNLHVEVNGYYYKKRIQIRVNNPEIVTNFVHQIDLLCLQ